MTAGWVAGNVRAKAMARRQLGADAARRLAACTSLPEAQRMLAATSYAPAGQPGQSLAAAQRAVADTVLWDLRVLAGWLPRDGVDLLRAVACWFELANVDELLQSLAGRPAHEEFRLGALATAWPRLRPARSLAGLRAALAASAWHDPGGGSESDIRLGLRARWAARVAAADDPARTWAAGAAALLLAGERFGAARAALPARSGRTAADPADVTGTPPDSAPVNSAVLDGALTLLGPAAATAGTLGGLRDALPGRARWALAGVSSPDGLWLAEAAWWTRVEADGRALLRTSGPDSGPVLGAVAVLAADARRVCAALETAARGGGALEAYDAVA